MGSFNNNNCMGDHYSISIVVPTKNRYKYLEPLIRLIQGFRDDEIELVIEDNSDDNTDFLTVLDKLNYSDLHYYYNERPISVGDNLDNAIAHSKGDSVCVIGDDDGVFPSIVNCVKWMKENDIDAVIPLIVSYMWPDYYEGISNNSGNASYILNDLPIVTYLNPKETLYEAMNKGFLDRGDLPICYHGIVKRTTLEKVYQVAGCYSPGPSPDIAAGVALSLVVDKYAYINYPIVISGSSMHHGGGAYRMKHGAAPIESLPFLPANTKENWEKKIPLIWTVETIWPESAIKALRRMGCPDLVDRVNYNLIWSEFFIQRTCYFKELWKVIDKKFSFVLFFIPFFIKRAVPAFLRRIGLLKTKAEGTVLFEGVNDIIEAANIVEKNYPEWPLS